MRALDPRFDRRRFLRGAGLGAALLPLLGDEIVRAGCLPAGRKRLITLAWGNGVQQWVSGTGAGYTLPPVMKALEPYRGNLLIPDAIWLKTFDDQYPRNIFDNEAHDSPVAHLLGKPLVPDAVGTRFAASPSATPSLDYWVGGKLKAANNTPYTALNLAVMARRPFWTWQAAAAVATPDDDPYHVFDTLFAGARMTAGGAPALDKVRLVRKSVLDYVKKDVARFSRTLGTDDRVRIDAHLSSIRELEGRLAMPAAVASNCAVPTLPDRFDVKSSDNFERTLRAQIDLGVAALAAGVSQVLTIQASNGSGTHVNLTWLGYKTGTPYGHDGCCADSSSHHASAHDNGAAKTAIDTWFWAQLAYLLGKLQAEKEGSSSLLDSSVVFVPNNMDHGNNHKVKNLPYLLAGSAGGYFKTGRLVTAGNASHTQVLASICAALGVPTDGFIDPAYPAAELPGLRG